MKGMHACRAAALVLVLAPALALILAWPLAAAAADAGKRITGPEVVRILHDEGYKAQLDRDGEGDPMVRTKMSGLNVYVYFYDCENDACGSLKLAVALDLEQGTTQAVLNRFSQDYRYARTYLDEENDPFMSFDFEVLHTDHAAHIASQIDTWENLLDDFARATGFRGREPAEQDETPRTGSTRARPATSLQ